VQAGPGSVNGGNRDCHLADAPATVEIVIAMIFLAAPAPGPDNGQHFLPTRRPAMPRYLAVVLALLLLVPPVAIGQPHKPAKGGTAKSKEARAKAQLEKAKSLLNAGKREQAIKRLRKIVRRYPRTRAAVEAAGILSVTPP
jgi:hypothetical protein